MDLPAALDTSPAGVDAADETDEAGAEPGDGYGDIFGE
jgi:hypothetical protein